jgi:hypothetical protein
VLPVALLLGAALIAGFTLLRGVDPFDEGLVLQAARRVAAGQAPYRDFLWSYGPAQPYVLGASFKAVGVSLLGWRVLRLACVTGSALLVFVLARRVAGTRLALVAWLAAACALAQPASANPFAAALVIALAALALITRPAVSRRHALAAGALLGFAAAWRLDFAAYGTAAALACLALGEGPARRRLGLCAALAGAAALVALAAYLPFAIAAGPGELYDEVLGKSLREGAWWTLPFPLGYAGRLRGWPPGSLLHDLKDVLDFYVPLLLVIGWLAASGVWLARLRAEGRAGAEAGLLVFGVGGGAYLLSRTDEFHTAPMLALLAVSLAGALAWLRPRGGRGAGAAALLCALLLALLTLYGVANRLSALLRPPDLAPLALAAADGVEAPPGEARSLAWVVNEVRRRVPPGRPIYVAPRRSDLVRFNNPLVYVLSERDNPLREDVGLQARPAEQARIVRALRRVRPRVVARWTDPLSARREPNKGGRPTGSRALDRYLASAYRELARRGHYVLLVPR